MRRGLELLLIWWLGRILLGLVAGLMTAATGGGSSGLAGFAVLDVAALGLAGLFVWGVFRTTSDEIAAGSTGRSIARFGALAVLAATLLAGAHGYAALAWQDLRSLAVVGPLVAELDIWCGLVAWGGLLLLLSGVATDRRRPALVTSCRVAMVMLVLATLASTSTAVLKARHMIALTGTGLSGMLAPASVSYLVILVTSSVLGIATAVLLVVVLSRFRGLLAGSAPA